MANRYITLVKAKGRFCRGGSSKNWTKAKATYRRKAKAAGISATKINQTIKKLESKGCGAGVGRKRKRKTRKRRA